MTDTSTRTAGLRYTQRYGTLYCSCRAPAETRLLSDVMIDCPSGARQAGLAPLHSQQSVSCQVLLRPDAIPKKQTMLSNCLRCSRGMNIAGMGCAIARRWPCQAPPCHARAAPGRPACDPPRVMSSVSPLCPHCAAARPLPPPRKAHPRRADIAAQSPLCPLLLLLLRSRRKSPQPRDRPGSTFQTA